MVLLLYGYNHYSSAVSVVRGAVQWVSAATALNSPTECASRAPWSVLNENNVANWTIIKQTRQPVCNPVWRHLRPRKTVALLDRLAIIFTMNLQGDHNFILFFKKLESNSSKNCGLQLFYTTDSPLNLYLINLKLLLHVHLFVLHMHKKFE